MTIIHFIMAMLDLETYQKGLELINRSGVAEALFEAGQDIPGADIYLPEPQPTLEMPFPRVGLTWDKISAPGGLSMWYSSTGIIRTELTDTAWYEVAVYPHISYFNELLSDKLSINFFLVEEVNRKIQESGKTTKNTNRHRIFWEKGSGVPTNVEEVQGFINGVVRNSRFHQKIAPEYRHTQLLQRSKRLFVSID